MKSSKIRFREFLKSRRDGDARDDSAHPTPPPTAAGDGRAPRPQPATWREYRAWLRPYAGSIALILAVAVLTAMTAMVMPAVTMHIVDHVLPAGDWKSLHLLGASLLVLILIQQFLDLLRHWRTTQVNARMLFRLRQRMFEHLLRLPLHELANLKTGGVTSRLSGDVDSVTGILQMALITPAVAGFKIFVTLLMLVLINWRLSLAALILLPPVILLNLLYIRRIRPIYRSIRKDRGEIDARVVETFGGIRVVRAFARETSEARRFAVGQHTVVRKKLRAEWLEAAVWSGWGFLIPLTALFIIWAGGVLVLRGQTTVGGILAFQMYMLMLLSPVSSIVQSYGQTQQSLAAMERVFDILRRPIDKPDRPGARPAPPDVREIVLDRVSFGYSAGDPVLHDVSLRVAGGMTVALVGSSGSGKTTLTNLVARFYDPDSGAIRLNGVDLRDLKLDSFRTLLGLVQQDVFLFDGTVSENIAYARRDATPEQIEHAARQANAHEFILELKDGYETLVGERGVRLSGGQAQRIAIARALLADPRILILDEATSNLDTQSEQLIQASLETLLANRTTFVIAHRLSTIVHADLIVVLENGRVIETGTHAELMSGNGSASRYREMIERQQGSLERGVLAASWPAE
ncbi:MAG: ABC transporter ATP-binding protein [Phycisphaerae bacterium]